MELLDRGGETVQHRVMLTAITFVVLGLVVASHAPTAEAATCTIGVGTAKTGTAAGSGPAPSFPPETSPTQLTISNYDPGTGPDRLLVVGVSFGSNNAPTGS